MNKIDIFAARKSIIIHVQWGSDAFPSGFYPNLSSTKSNNMQTIEIKGTVRKEIGKKSAKELRKQDHVPCVLYGQKAENIHFHAHKNEFRKLIYTPNSYVVELEVDKTKCHAILQKAEFHPVSDEIIHIDFYRIDLKKPFKTVLPVKTTGFAKGVQAGGVLRTVKRKLTVKGVADQLPDEIILDVTELGVGQSIKVSDLGGLYTNLQFLDPQSVVVSVEVTRAAKSEAASGTEGEEAEAQEKAE
jgi:large subunit ribosomal protein L25